MTPVYIIGRTRRTSHGLLNRNCIWNPAVVVFCCLPRRKYPFVSIHVLEAKKYQMCFMYKIKNNVDLFSIPFCSLIHVENRKNDRQRRSYINLSTLQVWHWVGFHLLAWLSSSRVLFCTDFIFPISIVPNKFKLAFVLFTLLTCAM